MKEVYEVGGPEKMVVITHRCPAGAFIYHVWGRSNDASEAIAYAKEIFRDHVQPNPDFFLITIDETDGCAEVSQEYKAEEGVDHC